LLGESGKQQFVTLGATDVFSTAVRIGQQVAFGDENTLGELRCNGKAGLPLTGNSFSPFPCKSLGGIWSGVCGRRPGRSSVVVMSALWGIAGFAVKGKRQTD
jgi:hypothetical protein